MPHARYSCTTPGCAGTGTRPGRCDTCRKLAEQRRGTAAQRGYGSAHRRRFRAAVLARDPVCTRCHRAPSTDADHWPLSRRELVLRGLDPNDPRYGRGLCHGCHSSETSQHQPGGWAGR
jgi:5-methylcytosine-specific restriction protein A